MAKKIKPLFTGSEWTFELLDTVYKECEKIAVEELKLDYYPNQIEIIGSDQMLDAYTSVGMPVMYPHWSFGKHYMQEAFQYHKGHSGLAYEIVINCNPTVNYLMEENSMTMQALVIAHAAFGHNSFFKNNYLFKQYTDASAIIDYLIFARKKIMEYEERYGAKEVEIFLDSCHALQSHGVDRYIRPGKLSKELREEESKRREEARQREVNDLWRTVPKRDDGKSDDSDNFKKLFLPEPEENLLYFLEKKAPNLEIWQREIIRIVRKIATYFYPQRQTQVMNEGWATFTHYYIMNRLWEKGLITDGSYLEFIHSHTSVVAQPSFDSKYYSGFNPYALGFNMFRDIQRICQNPTDEDRAWFPDVAGAPLVETLQYAMKNFRDESFILQYLSPKVMRDMKMFALHDDQDDDEYMIRHIHDEQGFKDVRTALSQSYSLSHKLPNIQIIDADVRGDRMLMLEHRAVDDKLLHKDINDVLLHLTKIWGYDVALDSVRPDTGEVLKTYYVEAD